MDTSRESPGTPRRNVIREMLAARKSGGKPIRSVGDSATSGEIATSSARTCVRSTVSGKGAKETVKGRRSATSAVSGKKRRRWVVSGPMFLRRRAREVAFQVLYQRDQNPRGDSTGVEQNEVVVTGLSSGGGNQSPRGEVAGAERNGATTEHSPESVDQRSRREGIETERAVRPTVERERK
ncbi:MAG: hypothetical protein Q4C47_07180, partial [Planctomycetia bacterium]|nr:hypothetical protein [Planctomycetia bacterium]